MKLQRNKLNIERPVHVQVSELCRLRTALGLLLVGGGDPDLLLASGLPEAPGLRFSPEPGDLLIPGELPGEFWPRGDSPGDLLAPGDLSAPGENPGAAPGLTLTPACRGLQLKPWLLTLH